MTQGKEEAIATVRTGWKQKHNSDGLSDVMDSYVILFFWTDNTLKCTKAIS